MSPKKSAKRLSANSIRLFGAPQPGNFTDTIEGKALTETAAIHFRSKKDKNISKLLAIEKLALDIFQDSDAARAFTLNPDEYMKRYGFKNLKLDLNSQEVKMVMAIGDPVAREAARRGDVEGFIDAILAQGIKPGVGLGKFVSTEAFVHSSALVYIISAVVTWQVVVTQTSIPVVIRVIGGPIFGKEYNRNVLIQMAEHIGDKEFSKKVASKNVQNIVDKYTELVQQKLKSRTE